MVDADSGTRTNTRADNCVRKVRTGDRRREKKGRLATESCGEVLLLSACNSCRCVQSAGALVQSAWVRLLYNRRTVMQTAKRAPHSRDEPGTNTIFLSNITHSLGWGARRDPV